MDVDYTEPEDWELLYTSDSNSVEEIKGFDDSSDDSEVLIMSDNLYPDGSVDEFEGSREMGFPENGQIEVGFNRVEEIVVRDLGIAENEKNDVGVAESGVQGEDSSILLSDSIGIEGNTEMSDGANSNVVDIVNKEMKSVEKRIVVWWKLPFEFLKCCVLRSSPVWTVSMAAAVMGCLILGRRYYSMKRKSSMVTRDDKKITQFKSRVVRLNEAFSVVKLVPIIRPSLPAAGVTPWPAMTLR